MRWDFLSKHKRQRTNQKAQRSITCLHIVPLFSNRIEEACHFSLRLTNLQWMRSAKTQFKSLNLIHLWFREHPMDLLVTPFLEQGRNSVSNGDWNRDNRPITDANRHLGLSACHQQDSSYDALHDSFLLKSLGKPGCFCELGGFYFGMYETSYSAMNWSHPIFDHEIIRGEFGKTTTTFIDIPKFSLEFL